ncbi:MAG: GNAT family N-acetyltransferase [Marinilabiliales bacterium]|nr:GNAT family N-acetyltransferase [Marinilabiliales bacterium]
MKNEEIVGTITLRRFQKEEYPQVALLCNDQTIFDNVRDAFPFPYTEQNAMDFIEFVGKEEPQMTFAVEYAGTLVGCVGLIPQSDVHRLGAELGYWTGKAYRGQGITTEAVKLLCQYAFGELKLIRLFSHVFSFNTASCRVLEKAGFQLEAICRKAIVKNGKISDEHRYVLIRED